MTGLSLCLTLFRRAHPRRWLILGRFLSSTSSPCWNSWCLLDYSYKSMFLHHKLLRRSFCDTTSSTNCVKPWFFIGLGNPGEKYQSMRHNVGFDMIDAFAQAQDIPMTSIHFKALFGEGALSGMVGDTPVLLEKPQTYMNLSGQSTGPLAAYYKLPLNRIIVMYDDMDLPCGVLRVQPKGWKNVIYHFRGNWAFGRLRIGIGRPPVQMDPKAFQLQRFNTLARERIDVALQEWVNILKTLVAKSLTGCARSANADQKYKHLRLQNVPVEALKLYRPGKILGSR